MAPEQTRIQADLRGLVSGDVACDPLALRMYASDASIYELEPVGVVRPRSTEDVVKTVMYAAEHGLSLFPRGGGSGLAGQSLGRGLVLDFSRYMRRVQPPQSGMVRVQCGIVQADLNRTLGSQGLLFGPDPATQRLIDRQHVIDRCSRQSLPALRFGGRLRPLDASCLGFG